MNQSAGFVLLAKYNKRMNSQLLDVCANLSKEELASDSGTFFCSVMDYWNHIMFGDLILLGRLRARDVNSEELVGLDDFTIQASDLIHHIFQHQTHHCGQLTAVLSRMVIEYGCTDLPLIVPEGSQN